MSKTSPLLAMVFAVGLVQEAAAEPSKRVVPELHKERSTRLFVETRPPGAWIELDGQFLGKSDNLFRVRPGRYTITVRLEGYRPQRQEVEIAKKRITRFSVELARMPVGASRGSRPPALPARPLVVPSRPRYSVLKLAWGTVPPADEPPPAAILTGHQGQVNCVEFSPDGRILASASADNTIRLWSVPGGRLRHVLPVHDSRLGVYAVDFSPDGKTLASCSGNVVRLWNAETGKLLRASGELEYAQSVEFSADGKTLLVATGPDSFAVCDTDSLDVESVVGTRLFPEVALLGHDDSVRRITYSQDGRLLACAGGWHPRDPGRLTIWDTSTARLLSSFQVPDGCVRGVAFSPDTKLLAYAAGKTVKLVEMARLPRPMAVR